MRKQLFLLLLCIPLLSFAQIPVGHWRTHLNYSNITQVAETPEKVYGVSDGALFSYNKEDQSVDVFTKVEGLNDTKIQFIAYCKDLSSLMIVYDNCNIDVLTEDGEIFNIPDIKNKNISNGKSVNRVNVFGKKAYLSMGYGISIIDLTKKEVSESYPVGNTLSAIILGNQIYAATDKGLYTASTIKNLVDPGSWTLYTPTVFDHLGIFQNQVYATEPTTGLYRLENGSVRVIMSGMYLLGILSDETTMVVFGRNIINTFDAHLTLNVQRLNNLYYVASDSPSNHLWLGMGIEGITNATKSDQSYIVSDARIKPSGPISSSPFRLKFSGEKLMVTGGGGWDDRFGTPGAIYFFENETWKYIAVDTIQVRLGVRDLLDIVEDPKKPNHLFVSSYGEGVYEFQDGILLKRHNYTNSNIETVEIALTWPDRENYDRTYGLCYDKDNNLFITNNMVANGIKIYTKDKNWISLNYSAITKKPMLFDLVLNKRGQFWLLSAGGGAGIFVFDPKTTLANQNDDQSVFFDKLPYMDNLELKTISPNNYYSIAEDKNGAMWIGTDMGPIIFNSPSKIFDTSVTCSRIKVPRNDGTQLADYLLEEEKINAIAVDGGNRKWLGTENSGIYLVSDNGLKTIYHFTTENSPLLSNKIQSIAIHPTTGEVFIGTDKGLISFRGDATEGKKNYDDVRVFPNPVRPNYEGLISITGLRYQSTVRITDTVGNSIYEGKSEGGQFTWNGRNRQGEKVATGVYLVYAAISDATEGVVTKILVVK